MGDNCTTMTDRPDLLQQTLGPAVRDRQTVRPDGERISGLLHGMSVHRVRVQTDERGTLTEMLDSRWEWHPDPIVYAYFITERPGRAKGWALHKEHEDRYFPIRGEVQLATYDVRPDSPTRGQVCVLSLSERDPLIVNIPVFVWHATRTLGMTDAILANFPTQPYDHANPDKYRLPLDTPLIPHSFEGVSGW
jgi:dTDP-4-dehydrorhamnose 3,5-epimerase